MAMNGKGKLWRTSAGTKWKFASETIEHAAGAYVNETRTLVGMVTGQALLVLGMIGLPKDRGGTYATILFLLMAPAIAAFVPLRGLDVLSRLTLAAAAALVMNGIVAEVMIATGAWSINGGAKAIGIISLMLGVVGWISTLNIGLLSRRRPAEGRGE